MDRRLKVITICPEFARTAKTHLNDLVMGMHLNYNKLVRAVEYLATERELLPRDATITWGWYSPQHNCYKAILWSERFDIVPDCEMVPELELFNE